MAPRRSPSPTFVATLSICIVFVPVLLLTGTARYLFTPLAMAVVFAMIASYLLSRTLVPTMMAYLLRSEVQLKRGASDAEAAGLFSARPRALQRRFEALPLSLHGPARLVAAASRPVLAASGFSSAARLGLSTLVGEDFFPYRGFRPDAASRARSGRHANRRDRARFADIEREIRGVIPPRRNRYADRQHRHSEQLADHRAGRYPDHFQRRRRDPDFAE